MGIIFTPKIVLFEIKKITIYESRK